jgi:pyrroline-5-carboxylate reductase
MNDCSIAFIGAGNMARSLIGGLLKQGHDVSRLIAADPDTAQRERTGALGVRTGEDNAAAIATADVVMLAVKPQLMQTVLNQVASALRKDQLLISIAAGIPLSALAAWCGQPMPIVRCMPNTPALYGAGITGMVANEHVTAAQMRTAHAILGAAGETVELEDESLLDAVTAVSGSGPAYVFYLLETMIDAGVELGLAPDVAARLAARTVYGAAVMACDSGTAPAELRRNVTSPGGTTERAVTVLDTENTRDALKRAIHAAATRSRELGAEFGSR